MKRVKPHKQRHVGLVSMLGSMLVWAVCWYVGEYVVLGSVLVCWGVCCFGKYVGKYVVLGSMLGSMLVWAVCWEVCWFGQ